MKLGSDSQSLILDRVFKNGPSKICWRQPLKNFTWSILEYIVSYVHANLTCLTWAFYIPARVLSTFFRRSCVTYGI